MDQKIVDLYDSFTHGGMNRRQFLDRLTDLAGSSAAMIDSTPTSTTSHTGNVTVDDTTSLRLQAF